LLEAASRHKSEFLTNMSHELRTPLNAIIGFSEVLAERMFGEVNEKQAEYLQDILSSGRHLLSLINDILDLSKVEAGRLELELGRFHLPTALDNALTLVRERATRHGITLTQTVPIEVGDIVADERKVKQILLNLLSNAVKFTPEGGRVGSRRRRRRTSSRSPSVTRGSASRPKTRRPSSRSSARWAARTPASKRARGSDSPWPGSSWSYTGDESGSRVTWARGRRSASRCP
jgi:signal transduction histidine kinase